MRSTNLANLNIRETYLSSYSCRKPKFFQLIIPTTKRIPTMNLSNLIPQNVSIIRKKKKKKGTFLPRKRKFFELINRTNFVRFDDAEKYSEKFDYSATGRWVRRRSRKGESDTRVEWEEYKKRRRVGSVRRCFSVENRKGKRWGQGVDRWRKVVQYRRPPRSAPSTYGAEPPLFLHTIH